MTPASKILSLSALSLAALPASGDGLLGDGLLGTENNPFGIEMIFGLSHTDNRDRVPNGGMANNGEVVQKEEDTVFRVSPTISFERQLAGRYDARVYYRPAYVHHSNPRVGSERHSWEHGFDFWLRFQLAPLTELILSDNYWWSGEKKWNYGEEVYSPEERALRNDDHIGNKIQGELVHDISADFNFSLAAMYEIKRYDNNAFVTRYDEDTLKITARLNNKVSRNLTWGVYSEYTVYDRGTHGEIDDDQVRVDNGVTYWNNGLHASFDVFANRRFIFTGRIGYNYLWYEADEVEDDDMMGDTSIELHIYQEERTRGHIGLRLNKTHSDYYPYSSQDDAALYGSVSTVIGRDTQLRLGVDAEYRNRKYDLITVDPEADYATSWARWISENGYDTTGDRTSVYLRLWANYQFSKHLFGSVFYSIEDVDSDVDNSYKENVYGVVLTVKFL
jgi:hypothetical protein